MNGCNRTAQSHSPGSTADETKDNGHGNGIGALVLLPWIALMDGSKRNSICIESN